VRLVIVPCNFSNVTDFYCKLISAEFFFVYQRLLSELMRKCFIVLVLTRFRSVCLGQQTSWFCKAMFWRNKRREDSVSVVGSVFGYSSQVWSPKNVTIIQRFERVQKREMKYILSSVLVQWDLPGRTFQFEPLTAILLALILGSRVLFQSGEQLGRRVPDVLPEIMSQTRTTRSSSGNQISFRPAKCKTTYNAKPTNAPSLFM
jgi:hypothetical protein